MTRQSNLCSVAELRDRLGDEDLKIVDASWYLPTAERKPQDEYLSQHIPSAVFFDIDHICDLNTNLPHMLPSATRFADCVGELGIENRSSIVVYDTAGLFSAARVWWMFKVFGHEDVRILDGGLPEWIANNAPVSSTGVTASPEKKDYFAKLDETFLVTMDVLKENSTSGDLIVLDARSHGRFTGQLPEPRPELMAGHMPNSISLPFDQLVDDGKLKSREQLRTLFCNLKIQDHAAENRLVTSCGSGVTAAIITLALAESDFGLQRLYDGAWAEWASSTSTVILQGT